MVQRWRSIGKYCKFIGHDEVTVSLHTPIDASGLRFVWFFRSVGFIVRRPFEIAFAQLGFLGIGKD